MKYKIYYIEHLVNGRKYVGFTSNELDVRMYQHLTSRSSAVHQALRSEPKLMKIVEIEQVSDEKVARERELYWIERLNTYEPHGWNRRLLGRPKKRRITDENVALLIERAKNDDAQLTESESLVLHVISGGWNKFRDIVEKSAMPTPTVHVCLRRLKEKRLIRRVGHGVYALMNDTRFSKINQRILPMDFGDES